MRRSLTTLAALATAAVLLAGCGSDDEPAAGDDPTTPVETTTSAAPTEPAPTTDSPSEPTEPTTESSEPTAEPTTPSVPGDAGTLCAAFETAFTALAGVEAPENPDDVVPPEVVELFHRWGSDLASATVPDDFTAEQRDGVALMSRLLIAIPDDARSDDLDALEDDLTSAQEDQVDSVTDYIDDNCALS